MGRRPQRTRIGGRGPEGVPPVERRLRRRSPGDRHRRGRLGHRAGGGGARGGRSRRERRVPADGHPFRPGVEGRRHRDRRRRRRRTAGRPALHLVATPLRRDADEDGHLVVPVSEIDVATDAELSYVTIQALGPRTWQLAHQASSIGAGATLDSFAVALGGVMPASAPTRPCTANRVRAGCAPPSSAGTTRCSTSGPSRTPRTPHDQ